ncbi:DUF4190 domain-containing protein [Nocardia cyriacigeorgica]|uniref:DUF4190 domain-containing protein n=2 Tax=Nocardia cyriacigeorgica TaxID=135487 RepID=H6RB27_NOCCG|nr:DUF4190 domain-containing protein [Nocardia cyriacigeorgica]MBF6085078.1 DUF4190 domain-containing protein [Nocardia cyriacigeorgica]MBF6285326.1 DUF4190 domain-containing protein [Nocardia cyriacigeorgica]MBF6424683.1 DUF4190 domain-containing protein [Nocardia cyriacigeorgica]NEW35267.1 DUF4190 domain-containing protein [Nocardia cyriacigeorgica]CCF61266.1 conserved exported protein of unknown function [Nocardia cyriacigeorgica GUH-2]
MVIPNQPIGQTIEHPRATLVLVLGAVSLMCCGVLGPVAWALGKQALDQINDSHGALSGRAQVMVGYILGVIGTIMMIIWALLFLLILLGGNA